MTDLPPTTRRGGARRRLTDDITLWGRTVAVLAAVGLSVCVLLVVTPWGQRLDDAPLRLVGLYYPNAWHVNIALSHIKPTTMAMVTAAVCLMALVRRRTDTAVGALVALVGANLTTLVVKSWLLPRPDYGVVSPGIDAGNTSPSGHTTAAMSFAVAVLLTSPRQVSYVATALASAAVTFAGVGMVLVHAHRPGDVVAGLCVGLVWAGAAVAVTHRLRRRHGVQERPQLGTLWMHAFVAVLAAFAAVAWIWSHEPTIGSHGPWGAAALVLGLLTMTVGAVLTVSRGARLAR